MLPKGKKGLSRLSIFYKANKTKDIRNKFYSKAQCFKADFSNATFLNVNFKGAILTSCSFKNTSFSQVEFLGTNLKKSNFTGATFRYCVFSGALMKKTNFKNCKFENCTFVNTNLDTSKNLVIDATNKVLKNYPLPVVDGELLALLNEFRFNSRLQNSRVLHLKGGKLNGLTVQSLIDRLGSINLKKGLKNLNGHLPYRVVTANGFCNAIDRAARSS
jgi:hypothetical protein